MSRNRLPLLVLVVAALLAVVALVAHGRPLAAGSGHGGLSSSFWAYTFTTVILVGALLLIATSVVLFSGIGLGNRFTPPPHTKVWMLLPTMATLLALGYVLFHYLHFRGHTANLTTQHPGASGVPSTSKPATFEFRWAEVVVVLGLLLVAGVTYFVIARRGRARRSWTVGAAPEILAVALDESLDDLRADPDLRRAIIAAYARMETALAAAGVPRRPAEAPLEYLERALLALDTSQRSVRRLTDLFQWARFSHHEPEPSMRDEAVEALETVRDELRAPAEMVA